MLNIVRFAYGSSLLLVLVSLGVGMEGSLALYVPWCRYLESLPNVRPQLHADNLKCSAQCPHALFGAARFTA